MEVWMKLEKHPLQVHIVKYNRTKYWIEINDILNPLTII